MKQGKNISRLTCWDQLKKIGFTPVKFNFQGLQTSIGCCLPFKGSEILIQPMTRGEWCIAFYCGEIRLQKYITARQIMHEVNEIMK
jgi:hypothetical protein